MYTLFPNTQTKAVCALENRPAIPIGKIQNCHIRVKKLKKKENFDRKLKKMRCHKKNEKMKKKWGVDSLKWQIILKSDVYTASLAMFPLGSLRFYSLNLMFNFLDHPCIYFKFEFNGSQDFLKAFELLIEALFLRSSVTQKRVFHWIFLYLLLLFQQRKRLSLSFIWIVCII